RRHRRLEVALAGVGVADRDRAGGDGGAEADIRVIGDVGDGRVADHRGVVLAVDGEADELLGAVGGGHREAVDMRAGAAEGIAAGEELHGAVGDRVRLPPGATLFPYTTLFRSRRHRRLEVALAGVGVADRDRAG